MTEFQMLLFLLGIHILGLLAVALLFIPAMRENRDDIEEDGGSGSDDGWGNRPNSRPDPSRWPGGGIPLPDAVQSTVRFRGAGRLSDQIRHRDRRPVRDPARQPARTPSHS